MPPGEATLPARIARLAAFLSASDVVRVRIERDDEEIELARAARYVPMPVSLPLADPGAPSAPPLAAFDAIKADLVGIVRFSRPAPVEGEVLDQDRELAFIEALGIRNPVHSLGSGRIASIAVSDGAPVEYGQALFYVDRG
ncbi:MAG TPA: biotin/lipoyl-containing protein [Candidatus Acidoferrales bacterium]|nr:biotin/lipoyl-containing protein [Candidatus Acidoferrales bacterium]